MKAFLNYIKAQIEARVTETRQPGGTPTPAPVTACVFKTIRMWNNQFMHSNGLNTDSTRKAGYRDEKAFPYPACFVEFIVEQTDNRCMGIVDYILTVRFRFGLQSAKFERLETFDFADAFKAAIQLMAPASGDTLYFTTFQEVITEFDEDHNNVEVPYVDYRTRYRSVVAYQRRNDVVSGPVDLTQNVTFTL